MKNKKYKILKNKKYYENLNKALRIDVKKQGPRFLGVFGLGKNELQ